MSRKKVTVNNKTHILSEKQVALMRLVMAEGSVEMASSNTVKSLHEQGLVNLEEVEYNSGGDDAASRKASSRRAPTCILTATLLGKTVGGML